MGFLEHMIINLKFYKTRLVETSSAIKKKKWDMDIANSKGYETYSNNLKMRFFLAWILLKPAKAKYKIIRGSSSN